VTVLERRHRVAGHGLRGDDDASVFVQAIEARAGLQDRLHRGGLLAGGWIGNDQLLTLAEPMRKSGYSLRTLYKPSDFPANWEQTDLWHDAAVSLASLSWLTTMALKQKDLAP